MLPPRTSSRLIAGICLITLILVPAQQATARPQYGKAMTSLYPDLAKKHGKDGKLSCAACHPAKSKKQRNNYGAALGKALGAANVKDEDAIAAAFKTLESTDSATAGTTFGGLIKAGDLPGTDDVVDGEAEWKVLFDGKSFDGWKKTENLDSWNIVDGNLQCSGERSHLFYVGDDEPFQNFEFECEAMTAEGSNAGIYFHTKVQEEGWPKYGYECQVNITHGDPKKSGSLYGTVNVGAEDIAGVIEDNKWYKTSIKVEGRHITIKVNDKVTVDYTEPETQEAFDKSFERRLGEGTFALQAHDPKSVVSFRNIKVRRLP